MSESRICRRCQYGKKYGGRDLCQIRGFALVRCTDCGLVYVYPQCGPEVLAEFYATYHDATEQLKLSEVGEQEFFQVVLNELKKLQPSGALLDVGSSYGYFLQKARAEGYRATGVEIAVKPAQYAQAKFGLDIFTGSLKEAKFPAKSFTVVTLLNVLEHLPDPFEALSEINRVLCPGGAVGIIVPNLVFGYPLLALRAINLLSEKQLRLVSVFDVPAHLFLFTPDSLRKFLYAAGFIDVKVRNAPVIYNVNRFKNLLKTSAKFLSDVPLWLSRQKYVVSYSMFATARATSDIE